MVYSDGFFLPVGMGYGAVGVFLTFSRCALEGMLGHSEGSNMAVQFATLSRFVEIIAFIMGIIMMRWKLRGIKPFLFVGSFFFVITTFLCCTILWWDIFPDSTNKQGHPTVFRYTVESIFLFIFLVISCLVIWRRRYFSRNVFIFLSTALILRDINLVFNMANQDLTGGWLLLMSSLTRMISYTYIYISIGINVLRNPFQTLYHNLNVKQVALQNQRIVVTWMIEQVPAITVLIDNTAKIQHINRFGKKSLHCSSGNMIIHQNFFDYFIFEDEEKVRQKISRLGGSPTTKLETFRSIRTIRDKNRIIEWTLKPMKDIMPMSTISNDGSDSNNELEEFQKMKNMTPDSEEKAAIEQADRIQILCIGRDITLETDREKLLIEAHQNSERASHMKDNFIANISHELRTPLNCIVGVSDVLIDSKQDHELIMMIKTSANSLLTLINDLLDFAKLKQGSLKLTFTMVNLRKFIEECVMSLSVLYQINHLELGYRVHKDCPEFIETDENRLRQVLLNLLSNAIKFTPKGFNLVVVKMSEERMEPPEVRFEVIDSGIGISESDLQRLFERFFQGNQATNVKPGTGIGLSLSRQFVELMGGDMSVSSKEGGGSTFYFTLPVIQKPREERLRVIEGWNSEEPPISQSIYKPVFPPGGSVVPSPHIIILHLRGSEVVADLIFQSLTIDYGFYCQICQSITDFAQLMRSTDLKGLKHLSIITEIECFPEFHQEIEQLPESLQDNLQLLLVLPSIENVYDTTPQRYHIDCSLQRPVRISRLVHLLHQWETGNKSELKTSTSTSDIKQILMIGDKPPSKSPSIQSLASIATPVEEIPSKEEVQALRLLIVEDDKTNQKVLELMLKRIEGIVFEMANNGVEGVEKFKEAAEKGIMYDCVFMDSQMPIMNGEQATREIRRLEGELSLKRTHVAALTANALLDEKENGFKSLVEDFITKPVSFSTLTLKINSLRAQQ